MDDVRWRPRPIKALSGRFSDIKGSLCERIHVSASHSGSENRDFDLLLKSITTEVFLTCHVFRGEQSSALFRHPHVSGLMLCFNLFETLLFHFSTHQS